ncbi:MAG TPA: hypothetical protein VFS32_01490 [Candidatus Limnocylindrales bacterium]|nr:hypothetical protein [Candidatus Limnocylindrales bacterium]
MAHALALAPRRRDELIAIAVVVAAASCGIVAAQARLAGAPIGAIGSMAALAAIAVAGGRRRLALIAGGLVFVAALDWAYVAWVAPWYGYSGLVERGVDPSSTLVVAVVATVPCAWLPLRIERPSDAIVWLLYLVAYVPAAVVPIHVLGPDPGRVLPLEAVLLLAAGTLGLMRALPLATLGRRGLSESQFVRLIVAAAAGALVYFAVLFRPTSIPDLGDVYAARAAADAIVAATPGSGYLLPWFGYVVYPLTIALGLARRRPLVVGLGLAGQVLLYAITGLKGIVFSVVFVPVLFAVIRWGGRHSGGLMPWGAGFTVLASVVLSALTGSLFTVSLFVRRLFVVPGQLTGYYYDFFTSHPTYQLSHSVLGFLTDRPYALDPPYLIGLFYERTLTDANANVWADAIANFGLVGVIPFTVLLGALLWLLDSLAAGRDIAILGAGIGFLGIILANGALLTQILTGGLGLAVLLVAVMPSTTAQTPRAVAEAQ